MAQGTQIAQAYVQIIPTTENISGNIEKSLTGVDKSFSVAGIAAGTAFGNAISNIVQSAVKKVAEFASETLKQSLMSSAEYEQLAGGIESIFQNVSMSQIAQDGVNAYKELGMSVNEYYDAIIKAGSAFKSTMGDQKAYDVARTGLKAISDYASGTGKDLATLTDKYQMITRSASSYQSIADQFSGLLPQTSKEFLKAAQSAGYLASGYKSLTDVPVGEYQEAVTNMLQDGVEALGMAGKTAEESSTTMSGAFNKMQKSWDNLVNSFTNPNLDSEQMAQKFVKSVEDFLNTLAPAIQEAAPALTEAFAGVIEAAIPVMLDLMSTLVVECIKQLPRVWSRQIASAIRGIVTGGVQTNEILSEILDILGIIGNHIIEKIAGFKNKVRSQLQGLFGNFIDVGQLETTINAVLNPVLSIIQRIRSAISEIDFSNFNLSGIASSIQETVNNIKSAIDKGTSYVRNWGTDLLNAAKNAMKNLVTGIVNGIKEAIQNIQNAGKNVAQGFVDGFTEKFQSLISKPIQFVQKMVDEIKSILGIHSPSRVMRDEVGKMMAEGLAIGFSMEMSKVNAGINADIQKEYSFGQNEIISSMSKQPSSNIGNSLASDIVKAMQNITVNNTVTLEGDAGKLFTAMQNQNRVYKNSTGRSAFA